MSADSNGGSVPTIVERGRSQAEQREAEQRDREAHWERENFKHTTSWFLGRDFYEDRWIRNPDYKPYSYTSPRRIENPANPFPEITDWKVIGSGDVHADSTFVCEGIRYICRWKYHGGGDRAYWDDGWWPEWYVVVERRVLGIFKRRAEVRVHGAAQVAEALHGL